MSTDKDNLTDTKKNPIKDTISPPDSYGVEVRLPDGQGFHIGSFTKTNKLITALYMVTDIIDNSEPIRHKLRTLGAEIISDIHSMPSDASNKIYEIMSFLDIAFAINIISEMNCSILKKEFLSLNQSIKDSTDKIAILNKRLNLSEFFQNELPSPSGADHDEMDEGELPHSRFPYITRYNSIGHSIGHKNMNNGQIRTRIGVQKGSTLLEALSNKTFMMSDNKIVDVNNFGLLKKQRRNEIISIIKILGKEATIKDIKDKIQTIPNQYSSLISCSEKTLQRELISMVKDNVLNKTGEKRWSKYFIRD